MGQAPVVGARTPPSSVASTVLLSTALAFLGEILAHHNCAIGLVNGQESRRVADYTTRPSLYGRLQLHFHKSATMKGRVQSSRASS